MKQKNTNLSKKPSVNPQGKSEDEASQSPQSQLEQRAKKKNTKL